MSPLLLLAILSGFYVYNVEAIAGGIESALEKRPYMASLQHHVGSTITHFCGASIVSTKYLLSSASCDPGTNLTISYARVGSIAYTTGGQLLKLASFILHPNYDEATSDFDFAIVTFNAGLEIELTEDTVKAINLTRSDPEPGEMMDVAGFGSMTGLLDNIVINFREANYPVMHRLTCKRVHNSLTQNQICTGGCAEGRYGTCFGDAGGAAEYNGTQFGVVTKVYGCDAPKMPSVFGRVAAAVDWIESIIGS